MTDTTTTALTLDQWRLLEATTFPEDMERACREAGLPEWQCQHYARALQRYSGHARVLHMYMEYGCDDDLGRAIEVLARKVVG